MSLVPKIKHNDWNSVRVALQKLSSLKLGPDAEITFKSLTLTDLTATRLIASDAGKKLVSTDLHNWVSGTSNQVNVADDGDGTITLSTPQDIHTAATPTFADLTLTDFSASYSITDTLLNTVNPGQLEQITVSDAGGKTVTWNSGKIITPAGTIVDINEQSTPQTLTDGAINYIVWDSDNDLTIQTDEPDGTQVPVAYVSVQNDDIIAIHNQSKLNTTLFNIGHALADHFLVTVADGLIVQEDTDATNDLDVYCTAGEFYHTMQDEKTVSAIYSRTTPMRRWYHSSGSWAYDTDAEIDNTQYDDGSDLTAISNNKWVKSLFMVSETEIHWIYPQVQYNTKAEAIAADLPTPPPGLELIPQCTALVMQEGQTDFSNAVWIDVRPLACLFTYDTSTIITEHGALAGLSDDDHPQYLLVDGTRAMSGNLDMNGSEIVSCNAITLANQGLHILDTDAGHDLIIAPGSDLTADRTLTITTGDSNRAITLNGNSTLDDWFDQGLKQADSPVFSGLTIVNLINEFSIDGTLGDNSDSAVPTEKAVKTYVDTTANNLPAVAFKTITGITNDVIADSADDTLTLASGNNILTIVGASDTDTITFTVDETKIDHNQLTNYAANEHINHSAVSVVAGDGLIGGGDITSTRTLSFDSSYSPTFGGLTLNGDLIPGYGDTYTLGSPTKQWRDLYINDVITVNRDIILTGGADADIIFRDGAVEKARIKLTGVSNDLTITSASGTINFNNERLSTIGTIGVGTAIELRDGAIQKAKIELTGVSNDLTITSVSGNINFSDENLSTTGTIGVGATADNRHGVWCVQHFSQSIASYGILGQLWCELSSALASYFIGAQLQAVFNTNYNLDYLIGVRGIANLNQNVSGDIDNVHAMNGYIPQDSAYTGTCINAAIFKGLGINDSNNITNAYGYYQDAITNDGILNAAIYLENVSGAANNYAIYSAGGTTKLVGSYNDTVGATNRDLYIDDTGKIGYLSSSINTKKNVEDLTEDDTSKIYQLRPVKFERINGPGIKEHGLIAEEVIDIMPQVVSYKRNVIYKRRIVSDDEGIHVCEDIDRIEQTNIPETVNYSRLIIPMLKELQLLRQEIELLKNSVNFTV